MTMRTLKILSFLLVAPVLLLAGCGKKASDDGKVLVVATIYPLHDVAMCVGGEHISATCLVPPGVSPHDWSPTAGHRRSIAEAKLFILAGPTDAWFKPDMLEGGARLLSLADLCPESHTGEHADEEFSHHHDPHFWLDPDNVAILAEAVGEQLAELDSEHTDYYKQRAADYAAQCRELATEMRDAAKTFKHKDFIAEHAAYTVMAESMGLRQVASIREVTSAGMTKGQIDKLVDYAIRYDVPVVFTEAQLPGQNAALIQDAARRKGHELKVLTLDPLGNPSVSGRETYLENMRTNLAAMKEGLGG